MPLASGRRHNVCEAFTSAAVVHGVNLEIADREFVILMGPSRRGKTAILRMVAGFENLISGDSAIDGIVANDSEQKDRDIALMFHDYRLIPA
jgi:multiple sugar transport system ATP-binding protein